MNVGKKNEAIIVWGIIILQVIVLVVWYWKLSELPQIARKNILPYKIFGWISSLGLIIYIALTVQNVKRDRFKLMRLMASVFVFAVFYNAKEKMNIYTTQYRFTLVNKTAHTIDEIKFDNHPKSVVNQLHPNSEVIVKLNYIEGEVFELFSHAGNKIDSVVLDVIPTKKFGGIYTLILKKENNKLLAEIAN